MYTNGKLEFNCSDRSRSPPPPRRARPVNVCRPFNPNESPATEIVPQRIERVPQRPERVPHRNGIPIPAALGRAPDSPPATPSPARSYRRTSAIPAPSDRPVGFAGSSRSSPTRSRSRVASSQSAGRCPAVAAASSQSAGRCPAVAAAASTPRPSSSRRRSRTRSRSRSPGPSTRSSCVRPTAVVHPYRPDVQNLSGEAVTATVEARLLRQEREERATVIRNLTDMQQFRRNFVMAALRDDEAAVVSNLTQMLENNEAAAMVRPFNAPQIGNQAARPIPRANVPYPFLHQLEISGPRVNQAVEDVWLPWQEQLNRPYPGDNYSNRADVSLPRANQADVSLARRANQAAHEESMPWLNLVNQANQSEQSDLRDFSMPWDSEVDTLDDSSLPNNPANLTYAVDTEYEPIANEDTPASFNTSQWSVDEDEDANDETPGFLTANEMTSFSYETSNVGSFFDPSSLGLLDSSYENGTFYHTPNESLVSHYLSSNELDQSSAESPAGGYESFQRGLAPTRCSSPKGCRR